MKSHHLLLDAGNTTLKLSFEADLSMNRTLVMRHGQYDIHKELDCLQERSIIRQISLASVYQPALTESVREWCSEHGVPMITASSQKHFNGLTNAYDDPAQLGVDRWLGMIAIWKKRQEAFFIVSCGSAVTFDAVDRGGRHLGGVIIPGPEMMRQSLISNTAAINDVNGLISEGIKLATNTQDAVNQGVITAVTALIEKMMTATGFNAEQGFLTGGCAAVISDRLVMPLTIDPDLVLKGLALYVEQAVKQ